MCGRISIQFRISDCYDCLIGDLENSGAAGQDKRPVLPSTQPCRFHQSLSYHWIHILSVSDQPKTVRAVRGTIPVSQGAYVPRSSLASASICSCAFWGRSWSGFINWVNGKAGERGVPVWYRTTTLYRVFGWTFSEFPLKATGLRSSFCLNLLAAVDFRRPPGVWRWSPSQSTRQLRGRRAMAAVSSKFPYCWLSSCRARSTSDIHWATGLYLLAHSWRNPPPHPIMTCLVRSTSRRWAVGTSSLVLLVVWFYAGPWTLPAVQISFQSM